MTDDAAHFSFARKLASNDLELRTQTLTNLSKFFGKSVNLLKEEDVQKIWMGLFYAMWMSDKPLVQRELSEAISKLVLAHGNADNAILFIKTFYITMHREFPKIDRLRHDKFLKFVRIFVNHSLQFIKQKEYDSEIIEKYIQAQTNIWDVDDAQEIQLHVCDVFFDELFYACGTEIPSAAVFQLAALFADTLTKTNHIILKQRIFEALKALINAASYCSPKLAPKKKHGLETDKDLFPDTEFVNITLTELVDWFMARASTKDKIQNRELLYKLKDEALKKSRAEPGFKLLPRTSIMKTVEDVERDEFKRLMDEHKKVQDALPKEPVLSKKDRKRKRLTGAAKAEGQEVADLITEEENQKKGKKGKAVPVPVPAPAAEETKQNNNKNKKQKVDAPATPTPAAEQNNNNKNKKQKVEAPATPTPAPEETKQNNKSKKAAAAVSPVAAKKKEESAPTITTTVTSTKKQKKNANGEVVEKVEEKVETIVTEDATSKKTEVTSTKAVKKTPTKKGGKKVEEEVVVEKVVEEKKKGKGKKEETEVPEEAPTKKTTKATPVIAPASANGKKRKVEEVVEEPAQNGTPVPAKKGKKGAKSEMVTPQKSEAVTASTPPSTGKKSVRFSKDNHVKEFDKLEAVATTPVTPSATKPKSVLNTPPSKVKVGKKK